MRDRDSEEIEKKDEKKKSGGRGLAIGILFGVAALGVGALAYLSNRTPKYKWVRVQNQTVQGGLTYRASAQNDPITQTFRDWMLEMNRIGRGTFVFFNEGALPADWPEEDVSKTNRLRVEFRLPEDVQQLTLPPAFDLAIWARQ